MQFFWSVISFRDGLFRSDIAGTQCPDLIWQPAPETDADASGGATADSGRSGVVTWVRWGAQGSMLTQCPGVSCSEPR
ncbi:hypothetical protein ACS04_28050 [Streptomyces roseus]|uniref:Uncharacterized protein n=1 Tax=Streptomyces roseus TaxID=66430 RepID=A0A0J7AB46_9ACTN|nr:hypothetical protein ACS04_28050 [Streptomyces roseus]